ncbi:hypothetical protein BZG36_00655 [Bifiguratus adelaidae]|uniref:NADH-ubiquinone oxidoreductase 21kDa subunit N-terminal domain-containing protein n=1 Tax=Bifiguratus adelaidae TaxID=1938954 RepID=A0A261Y772_9FUNG|nr:hypothetical protein BZG36_00655 [Bifiguratus adelaidae]
MPERAQPTPFEVIDTDPHVSRVVRYFRPSDYAVWGAATVAAPAFLIGLDRVNSKSRVHSMGFPLRLATFIGAVGGFMLAYQRSSYRFWGWAENGAEVVKDKEEMRERIAQGKPLYGESQLTPYLQEVSARNSRYAATKFNAFPWFNFANHQSHGVDESKYQQQ